MRVTVCELPAGWMESPGRWEALGAALRAAETELLLLPEMGFHRWLAGSRSVDPAGWQAAVASHDRWIGRLHELGVPTVAGTRPVVEDGRRYNRAFLWRRGAGCTTAHAKYYLPDEPGFWEATWYQRGGGDFRPVDAGGLKVGFLICTEMWFGARARAYARAGIDLLLVPRATPVASVDTWLAGGRTAAFVSGAFCLSSNFNGPNAAGMDFGGGGWVAEPEGGTVMGVTTREAPLLTVEIDPRVAREAQNSYPRYVRD